MPMPVAMGMAKVEPKEPSSRPHGADQGEGERDNPHEGTNRQGNTIVL